MNGYVSNIEKATLENTNFRKVIYTAAHCQLVLMSLQPSEEIGLETHTLDQFLRIEQGSGQVILNGERQDIMDGSAIVVPAGVEHNIINTSKDAPLKLYTLYAPPEHKDGIVHKTKYDAEADTTDHFDGQLSTNS